MKGIVWFWNLVHYYILRLFSIFEMDFKEMVKSGYRGILPERIMDLISVSIFTVVINIIEIIFNFGLYDFASSGKIIWLFFVVIISLVAIFIDSLIIEKNHSYIHYCLEFEAFSKKAFWFYATVVLSFIFIVFGLLVLTFYLVLNK